MITANVYERTYCCVSDSLNATRHLDKVVEFLQSMARPVTCQEIGLFVWGNSYKDFHLKNSYSAQLGQMLRHLRKGGFVKVDLVDGTPITITHMGYIEPKDADAEPEFIKVHDDKGREYDMPNPNYRPAWARGTWGEVTETITPKIKTYVWAAK